MFCLFLRNLFQFGSSRIGEQAQKSFEHLGVGKKWKNSQKKISKTDEMNKTVRLAQLWYKLIGKKGANYKKSKKHQEVWFSAIISTALVQFYREEYFKVRKTLVSVLWRQKALSRSERKKSQEKWIPHNVSAKKY